MNIQLERSMEIVRVAIELFQPKLIVSLVSGGDDSLTAYYVARLLGVPLDYIVHIDTQTGIPETHQFVAQWGQATGIPLLVRSAGMAYENYLDRKGFFGRGQSAHQMSYHVLKAGPLRKAISSLRQRRKNFPVLMLTGIRLDESDNRKYNFAKQTYKRDPAAENNIFVNLIEHWSQQDCREFLSDIKAPRNPVSKALHRSGECMCGTMQSTEDRELAGILFPEWKQWLDRLEAKTREKHGWGWGENMPDSIKLRRAGQLPMLIDGLEMCRHCIANTDPNL